VLADVLRAQWPAIVFCRTKHGADRLTKQLTRAGVSAVAIHGDRSQGQRSRALEAFANGQVQALVATDVAARGIHVDDVAIVVHFDPPGSDKDYVHRSGRTGRAGQRGLVLSFIDHDQRHAAATLQRSLGLDAATESVDISSLQVAHRERPRAARAAASATGAKRRHRDLAQKQGRGPRRKRRR
jgi:superfamily II DNA/RNA helicase